MKIFSIVAFRQWTFIWCLMIQIYVWAEDDEAQNAAIWGFCSVIQ